jgi:phosphatidylserine decarboxylase
MKTALRRLLAQEDLNFLLTNRVPRIALTHLMGRFSKIRHPWVSRASIAVWKLFTDLDLSDARQRSFASLHDCFTRELMAGARIVDDDPRLLTSPCDAIVGECGEVADMTAFQAKGFAYRLEELFGPGTDPAPYRDGCFVTLRLTSAMYHRFHAPHDCDVHHVSYLSGDTWNVNPIALKRVERLFCRNERAVISARLRDGHQPIALVAVAAILVASIRLRFIDVLLHLRFRGPNEMPVQASFGKGEEMGGFEHGSTILLFVPRGFEFADGIVAGQRIRMGQALMRLPPASRAADDADDADAVDAREQAAA